MPADPFDALTDLFLGEVSPNHARAPEAMLAIANCQIELKDSRAARSTLESLIKTYPQSEAAQTGKERLARLTANVQSGLRELNGSAEAS